MSTEYVKILVHLHRPPLPMDGGDKRRLMGMLNYFSSRHDSVIIDGFGGNTAGRVEWAEADIVKLSPYFRNFWVYQGQNNILDFIYSRSQSLYYQKILREQLPIDTDYFAPPNYVRYVEKIVREGKYDYLWLNYIEYAALAVKLKKHHDIKILIDIHDLGCQGRLAMNDLEYLQKLKFDYDKNLVKEAKLLNKFDKLIVNSQAEISVLKSYIPEEKLVLIPHLLQDKNDSQHYIPYGDRQFDYDLLFVGTGRTPNLKAINFFLQDIFPQIVTQKPDTILALAGSLGRVIQIPPELSENIIDLGYVSDLSTVYLHTRIVICPLLKGAGTKVKLQEALKYAVPIVTTTVGASGLKLKDRENAYITDEPQEFATQILALLRNEQLCQRFSTAAELTFKQHYSTERVYLELDKLLGIQ